MKISILLLDLGQIVLELDWDRVFSILGIEGKIERKNALSKIARSKAHDLFDKGKIPEEDFFIEIKKLLRLDHDPEFLQKAWSSLIIGPFPETEQDLLLAKDRVRICALSNTNWTHVKHFKSNFSIFGHFERIFTSCEIGYSKPQKEIFEKVLAQLDVAPEEILFIDDRLENVEMATKMGIRAEHSPAGPKTTGSILRKYQLV